MPWPWQQSKWRPLLAQVAMWVVLGATVGVAALVDRRASGAGASVSVGPVRARLPDGWVVEKRTDDAIVAVPYEGTAPLPERSITISREGVEPGTTADRYLATRKGAGGPYAPYQIAGQPAVVTISVTPIVRQGGRLVPAFELWGCAVLPSAEAVTVNYQGQGAPSRQDEQLFERVARSVKVAR